MTNPLKILEITEIVESDEKRVLVTLKRAVQVWIPKKNATWMPGCVAVPMWYYEKALKYLMEPGDDDVPF
ncbi:hypothetical protein LCGC14_0384150 [marine sediment metagenome]|uniref:Uncharacterized protein n=1 Tax=marine sediment metagenome TaxID=412755 RepID=A0A0F9VNI2_9ZZZZ